MTQKMSHYITMYMCIYNECTKNEYKIPKHTLLKKRLSSENIVFNIIKKKIGVQIQ
jgi:hypothetical protein